MTATLSRNSRRVPAGVALAALGVIAVVLGAPPDTHRAQDLRYGVSRVDGEPGIAIHWVVCARETASAVDLQAYQGGSVTPNGIPVFWQIRTDAAAGGPARVETFVVGETPPGYYETVPFVRRLPDDLIVITGPPSPGRSTAGMSFELDELPTDAIHRGGYETVSPEDFASRGIASCPSREPRVAQGIGFALIGAAGIVLARRRRPVGLGFALALLGIGAVGIVSAVTTMPGPPPTFAARQSGEAFQPGTTALPPGARVLATISPATTRELGDGFFVARIHSPGEYALAIECTGVSIQVGEGAELPNGGTGSRQLLGCATGQLVRGGIAGRLDRSDLVEIVVDAAGAGEWHVVVVEGPGAVGPFSDP